MIIAGTELFKKLVTASGLSPVFAERSFERLLTRAGFTRHSLTRGQIETLLPQIESMLLVYLPGPEVTTRLNNVRALTTGR
jgi:hypothetical protein